MPSSLPRIEFPLATLVPWLPLSMFKVKPHGGLQLTGWRAIMTLHPLLRSMPCKPFEPDYELRSRPGARSEHVREAAGSLSGLGPFPLELLVQGRPPATA